MRSQGSNVCYRGKQKENIGVRLFGFFILFAVFCFLGENIFAKGRPSKPSLGKVIFLSEARKEILFEKKDSTIFLLSKGNSVHVCVDRFIIRFDIVDIADKYVRCKIYEKMESLFSKVKDGDEVFDSRKINSKNRYYDAKILLSSLIILYKDFIYNVESTEDPALLANYVLNFSENLDLMIPGIVKMNDLYPELSRDMKDMPDEVKSQAIILQRLESRLGDVFYKIKMQSGNEIVADAAKKLHNILEKLKEKSK